MPTGQDPRLGWSKRLLHWWAEAGAALAAWGLSLGWLPGVTVGASGTEGDWEHICDCRAEGMGDC